MPQNVVGPPQSEREDAPFASIRRLRSGLLRLSVALGQFGGHGEKMADPMRRWNHNIHYHRRVLDAAPQGARTALDVGTGDGLLAAKLSTRSPRSPPSTSIAPSSNLPRTEQPRVKWVHGDVVTFPFAESTFDIVASIAAVHHLPDTKQALQRLAELTSPGGQSYLNPARVTIALRQRNSTLDRRTAA